MINESLSLTLSSSLSLFSSTPSTKLTGSSNINNISITSNNSDTTSSNTSNTSNTSLSNSSTSKFPHQIDEITHHYQTPILDDLLTSSIDMIPYVFDFKEILSQTNTKLSDQQSSQLNKLIIEPTETPKFIAPPKKALLNKRKKSKIISSHQPLEDFCLSYYHKEDVSLRRDDYFKVEPEDSKSIELAGSQNSLFLALARSFLYKYYFENKKYEFIIRIFCLNTLNSNFKLDSDIALQQILRKKLCYYWLSYVNEGKFTKNCKYTNLFNNVCDFIYQVYQISINNFSDNRLFELCALDDIANLFDVNIIVFNEKNEMNEYDDDDEADSLCLVKHKHYTPNYNNPNEPTKDYVFLSYNKNEKINFKWLMPNAASYLIKKSLLNTIKQDVYFLKTNANYAYQFLLIESHCLLKCFGDLINNNLNLLLFFNFLSECSVHTLTSLKDLNFDDLLLSSEDPNEMINYLNQLWGQNHFSLKEILKKLDLKKETNWLKFSNSLF